MLESKVSRRTVLKVGGVLAGGLAATAVAGHLVKSIPVSGTGASLPTQGSNNAAAIAGAGAASGGSANADEPLVLMVKGNEVVAYQGTSETKFVDSKLSGSLIAKFGMNSNPLKSL